MNISVVICSNLEPSPIRRSTASLTKEINTGSLCRHNIFWACLCRMMIRWIRDLILFYYRVGCKYSVYMGWIHYTPVWSWRECYRISDRGRWPGSPVMYTKIPREIMHPTDSLRIRLITSIRHSISITTISMWQIPIKEETVTSTLLSWCVWPKYVWLRRKLTLT